MANSTAGTITDRAWKKLRKSGTSTDVPALQETEMLATLNDIVNEWRRAHKLSGEPEQAKKKETAINIRPATSLADDTGATDDSFDVASGDDLESSGALVIYDDGMPDIIEYTSNTNDEITGITGLDWAHDEGDQVLKLYALPSNFHSFRSTPDCKSGVKVNNTPYRQVPDDPKGGEFAVYDNGTTKYLWLPPGLSGTARVLYNKTTTTIDDTSDLVEWEPQYDEFGIWRLVEMGAVGDDIDLNANKITYAKGRADKVLKGSLDSRMLMKMPHLRPINRGDRLTQDEYYRLVTRDS